MSGIYTEYLEIHQLERKAFLGVLSGVNILLVTKGEGKINKSRLFFRLFFFACYKLYNRKLKEIGVCD